MTTSSVADAAEPYLEYLEKEMTIQGVLSAFCVAAGAVIFEKVLGANSKEASDLVLSIQCFSFYYVIAAVTALLGAALFFYLQRSDLAWLYGQISFAAVHKFNNIPDPSDTSSFEEGLDIGNSWTLWNWYQYGMSFLVISGVECAFALIEATCQCVTMSRNWILALAPFGVVALFDLIFIFHRLRRKDEKREGAAQEVERGGEAEDKAGSVKALPKERRFRSVRYAKKAKKEHHYEPKKKGPAPGNTSK
jgi:hypothetical protein